jgi:uncharacterized membrane protein
MKKRLPPEPHHFTKEDFVRAFFGSFIVTLSFIFAGSLVNFAVRMNQLHIMAVVIITFAMLTFEIYALGYQYVNDRKHRPFLEFWAKRFFSITVSSFISIMLLLYAYGVNNLVVSTQALFKVGIAIFLPATTVGGAMEILKKK